MTTETLKNYSKLIREQLFSCKQYESAEIILIYISYLSEVSTFEIIEHSLNLGKKVFCPKVLGSGIMEFYEITSLKDVVLGYKNIPEPKNTESSFKNQNPATAIMVIPLVGFDDCKNRLGYGGGFYDRYLQRFPNILSLGLAMECQRYRGQLPIEATDLKPNYIITENGIF